MYRLHRTFRLIAVITLLSLAGCQGGTKAPLENDPQFSGEQSIEQVLSDLVALPTPEGVDMADFEALKDSLREQLLSSGVSKFAARLPRTIIDDLTLTDQGNGFATLTWSYKNSGDYDMNGMVNIADLTPLGANLNMPVDTPRRRFIDGNGDGGITISDLTPLGAGFQNYVTGYEIFYLSSLDAACWDSAGTVDLYEADMSSGVRVFSMQVPFTGVEQYKVAPFNPVDPALPEEDTSIPTEPPPPPPPVILGAIAGVVRDGLGTPIEGVAVTTPGADPATTDSEGRYFIGDLQPIDEQVVSLAHADYTEGSLRVSVSGGITTQADATLLARPTPVVIDASEGGVVEGLMTSVKLVLPPNALVDRNGVPLEDNVDVQLTYIDPTDPVALAAAPGDMSAELLGGEIGQLESFGMAEVFIDDGSGEAANLAPGAEAELTIPIPAEQQATAPPTMGLFSFDEAAGRWVEEGILVKNPAGTAYVANVPHFSFWNADAPLAESCIRVRVTTPEGVPVQGATVHAEGVDYEGATSRTSDAEGYVAFPVKANATERLWATLAGVTSQTVDVATPDENGRCSKMEPAEIPVVATLELSLACASVRVVEEDGAPIAKATVILTGLENNDIYTAFTNDEGYAALTLRPEATFEVMAKIAGFESQVQQVSTPPAGCIDPKPVLGTLEIDYNLLPLPSFEATPINGKVPVMVTFDGSASSDPDGSIVKFEWDLDGYGGPLEFADNGSNPVIQHQFTVKGYYFPVLRVWDNDGAYKDYSRYVCFN